MLKSLADSMMVQLPLWPQTDGKFVATSSSGPWKWLRQERQSSKPSKLNSDWSTPLLFNAYQYPLEDTLVRTQRQEQPTKKVKSNKESSTCKRVEPSRPGWRPSFPWLHAIESQNRLKFMPFTTDESSSTLGREDKNCTYFSTDSNKWTRLSDDVTAMQEFNGFGTDTTYMAISDYIPTDQRDKSKLENMPPSDSSFLHTLCNRQKMSQHEFDHQLGLSMVNYSKLKNIEVSRSTPMKLHPEKTVRVKNLPRVVRKVVTDELIHFRDKVSTQLPSLYTDDPLNPAPLPDIDCQVEVFENPDDNFTTAAKKALNPFTDMHEDTTTQIPHQEHVLPLPKRSRLSEKTANKQNLMDSWPNKLKSRLEETVKVLLESDGSKLSFQTHCWAFTFYNLDGKKIVEDSDSFARSIIAVVTASVQQNFLGHRPIRSRRNNNRLSDTHHVINPSPNELPPHPRKRMSRKKRLPTRRKSAHLDRLHRLNFSPEKLPMWRSCGEVAHCEHQSKWSDTNQSVVVCHSSSSDSTVRLDWPSTHSTVGHVCQQFIHPCDRPETSRTSPEGRSYLRECPHCRNCPRKMHKSLYTPESQMSLWDSWSKEAHCTHDSGLSSCTNGVSVARERTRKGVPFRQRARSQPKQSRVTYRSRSKARSRSSNTAATGFYQPQIHPSTRVCKCCTHDRGQGNSKQPLPIDPNQTRKLILRDRRARHGYRKLLGQQLVREWLGLSRPNPLYTRCIDFAAC